jgi:hypothetical protein
MVERVLGKDEVTGSIPVNGSRISVTPWAESINHSGSKLLIERRGCDVMNKGFHYGEREI